MSSDATHRIRTLWLAGALHAFTHVYQVALLPLYLLIQQDLRLANVSQATLLVTVMMAGYFLPAYPLGVAAWRQPVLELGLLGLMMTGVFLWLAPEETSPTRAPTQTAAKNKTSVAPKLFPTGALWGFFLLAALAFSLRDFTGSSMGS